MVQAYWENIEGKEERERLAEEKERKRMGKEIIKSLRKRWALAVKVVRAKILEAQKQEQDRLGKEHLQNILQRSTGLLEAQIQGSNDSGEEEGEDNTSDNTDDSEEDDEINVSLPLTCIPPESVTGHDEEDVDVEDDDDEQQGEEDSSQKEDENDASEAESDEDNISEHNQDLRFLISDDVLNEDQIPAICVAEEDRETSYTGQLTGNKNDREEPKEMAVQAILDGSDNVKRLEEPHSSVSSTADIGNFALLESSRSEGSDASCPPTAPVLVRQSSKTCFQPRTRKVKLSTLPLSFDPDPDINDPEFNARLENNNLDGQDEQLDVEMEEAEDAGRDNGEGNRDSEDEGLLADADLPIEVLLRRYGYPIPEDEGAVSGEPEQSESKGPGQATPTLTLSEALPSTKLSLAQPVNQTDQSLTNTALAEPRVPEQLIINGKRQRRKKEIWTPDDSGPQHLVGKKRLKRVEIVEEVETGAHQNGDALVIVEEETMGDEENDDSKVGQDEGEYNIEEEDDEDEEEEGAEEDDVDWDDRQGQEGDIGSRVRQPFLLRGTLRPYQQAGLEWLASLWSNNMNGILADEMGLGKTIQTIALIGHLACDKGVWGQHLIIVPTSVILNWEMEFKKFLPGMKVLTYYGNQKERKEKRVGWHTENTWQVCITSYQIVLADQHIFRRKNWCYMILDEAHNIKNFRSQRWQTLLGFKAQRRLLLTGTPLQNNLMELWSLLYFLMPGGIGADATAVVGFANHKEFMEWFSNPMDKAIETGDAMDEETLETVAKLHTLLRPFILRRLKSEVETQLPGKFEHVVYCRLSKRQRFLYDEFMSRASTHEALTTGGYLGVMNTLMQLRKVCNHPDLFEVRPVKTSFAMDNVARDFEPRDILIRKRLLAEEDERRIDVLAMGFGVSHNEAMSGWVARARQAYDASGKLPYAASPLRRGKLQAPPPKDTRSVELWLSYRAWAEEECSKRRWESIRAVNRRRCGVSPIYGSTFLSLLGDLPNFLLPQDVRPRREETFADFTPPAAKFITSLPERAKSLEDIIDRFAVIPPNAIARNLATYALPGLEPISHPSLTDPAFDTLHRSSVKLQIAFPDASLLQYDCGKLQKLFEMLRDLKSEGHRVLIFTQMTRVLDILEMFLSHNGHRYLRLDGSTKIEDRQVLTERFNSDSRIFVFIASSRSGGVGINLTGADTVFFYDSDWNPSMDRQCMDRAHRIGQTREVHIYRFVSSHTVEENMLRKAEQKRLLDKMVIQEGGFNNDWWGRVGWKDMFGDVPGLADVSGAVEGSGEGIIDIRVEGTPVAEDVEVTRPRAGEERELARALAEVEDEEDVQAARMAQGEGELDLQEFEEGPKAVAKRVRVFETENSGTPATTEAGEAGDVVEEYDDEPGSVEDYMLKWVEEDWDYFSSYRA